jgi:3-methyladenine DNA glycosylase/8-oxoguanine DNA glycosylase
MAPDIVGVADRGELVIPEAADPRRVLRDARLRARGLRLVRVPWLYELLVLIVIQQRVAHPDAMASHRHLLRRHGTLYSEGDPTLLFPSPLALSRMSPETFRDAGIDRERAERLRTVGRLAKHLPRIAAMPFAEARASLAKVPGLGPWTIEHFLGAGLADADAVPTADYWYPHTVAYALTGQERTDDVRMLELLEPFRPQRYRALLWLMAAGVGPAPPA